MKRASITYTKNNLSRILGMVREGESVLVLDRNVPVARIEPVTSADISSDERLSVLVAKGIVTEPVRRLDVEKFLSRPMAKVKTGVSVVQALLDEREEGM